MPQSSDQARLVSRPAAPVDPAACTVRRRAAYHRWPGARRGQYPRLAGNCQEYSRRNAASTRRFAARSVRSSPETSRTSSLPGEPEVARGAIVRELEVLQEVEPEEPIVT